eukprot:CAMPEP_0184855460 /NCGR_PEP_ID=MMETSP0580-20130426/706_1 /TAXON_ID=1118495 /ORGANISM="Dactyliosolen fragilissimus" /LENGTH=400 /DNA_ID=CAMNT_0027349975 /DNA_START=57 /DNA_END=1259 /DNA_ORIENTATION=-
MINLLILSNITIAGLWVACQFILIPYVVNLLILVTAILYSGCHYSLMLRKEQALSRGEKDPNASAEDDDKVYMSETLRKEDAMKFPIFGSMSLFSLYLAFKFFDKETVNLIISAYFGLIGCFAISAVVSDVISLLGGPFTSIKIKKEIQIPRFLPKILQEEPWDFGIDVNLGDILSFIGSAVFMGFYLKSKHWTMNNVIGICFCLKGIESFSLGTYKIGAILLIGLFFYDIFWVFGTDVMVTVAKSLDGPIKIYFPRSLTPNEDGAIDLSLLGLGDIVIPGFFLSLLLRFDAHNAKVPYFSVDNVHYTFPKPYFHSSLIGYIIGMALTMFVMIKFQAAQPALLYLVPACLGSSFLTAVIRGEIKQLLDYSEEDESEDIKPDGDVGEKKTEANPATSKKDD